MLRNTHTWAGVLNEFALKFYSHIQNGSALAYRISSRTIYAYPAINSILYSFAIAIAIAHSFAGNEYRIGFNDISWCNWRVPYRMRLFVTLFWLITSLNGWMVQLLTANPSTSLDSNDSKCQRTNSISLSLSVHVFLSLFLYMREFLSRHRTVRHQSIRMTQ